MTTILHLLAIAFCLIGIIASWQRSTPFLRACSVACVVFLAVMALPVQRPIKVPSVNASESSHLSTREQQVFNQIIATYRGKHAIHRQPEKAP